MDILCEGNTTTGCPSIVVTEYGLRGSISSRKRQLTWNGTYSDSSSDNNI